MLLLFVKITANYRHSHHQIDGLMMSQSLTLCIMQVFYVYMERFKDCVKKRKKDKLIDYPFVSQIAYQLVLLIPATATFMRATHHNTRDAGENIKTARSLKPIVLFITINKTIKSISYTSNAKISV